LLVIDETRNGQKVDVSIGDTIEIRLEQNASTGFRWSVTASCDPICPIVEDDREAPAPAARGASGHHRWRLRAVQSGECDFVLAYRRPWESERPPAREFRIRIRVRA
jgi:inhibitor of cysteine peptidase